MAHKSKTYNLTLSFEPYVSDVVRRIQASGRAAYLTGGAVRDALLGRGTTDVDIATDMPFEQFSGLFAKDMVVAVLPRYQCVRLRLREYTIDVTAFRAEGRYVDHRRPVYVETTSREADARRRDLTMNAFYYDPISHRLIDDFDGLRDLFQLGAVRLIRGQASLEEDYLRILRVIRFSLQCGLTIEHDTWRAVRACIGRVARLSPDRVRQEIEKCLARAPILDIMRVFEATGLLALFHISLAKHPYTWRAVNRALDAANISQGSLIDFVFLAGLFSDPPRQIDPAFIQKIVLSKKQLRHIRKAYRVLTREPIKLSNFHPTPLIQAVIGRPAPSPRKG